MQVEAIDCEVSQLISFDNKVIKNGINIRNVCSVHEAKMFKYTKTH